MSIFFLATETWFGFLLHQKRDWNKVPKTDFHTELTETSNLIFCVATRFVSPIKVSVGSPTVVVQDSIEKVLIWFLYQIFDVRERTECCVLNQLGFQNHVSTLVEARFFAIEVSIETLQFWPDVQVEKMLIFFLPRERRWSEISKRCNDIWFISMF